MKGLVVHGVLLVVAALVALQTYTRDRLTDTEAVRVVIWDRDTTEVRSIAFTSPALDMRIDRDDDGGEAVLWGTQIVRTTAGGGAPAAAGDEADLGATADTARFPVGRPGRILVEWLAEFRVIRDLGPLGDRGPRFGLVDPTDRLTVTFTDGARELALGREIVGGSDRYGLDLETGDVVVVPSEIVGPLQTGVGALRERSLHYFLGADVGSVRVQMEGRELVMNRSEEDPRRPAVWTGADTPDQPDQSFANFMERVDQLVIAGFEVQVSPEEVRSLLRIDYMEPDGDALGFLELLQRTDGSGEYFLLSERTLVPALAVAVSAERVHSEIPGLF